MTNSYVIPIVRRGRCSVFKLPARVTGADANRLWTAFREEGAYGPQTFVLDFGDNERIDLATLAVIVKAYRWARVQGGDVVFVRPSASVQRLLARTRLEELFRQFASVQASVLYCAPEIAPGDLTVEATALRRRVRAVDDPEANDWSRAAFSVITLRGA